MEFLCKKLFSAMTLSLAIMVSVVGGKAFASSVLVENHPSSAYVKTTVPIEVSWTDADTQNYNLGIKISNIPGKLSNDPAIWVESFFELSASSGQEVFNLNIPEGTAEGSCYILIYLNHKQTGWDGRAAEYSTGQNVIGVLESTVGIINYPSEVTITQQAPIEISWEDVDFGNYELGLKIGNDLWGDPNLIWIENIFPLSSSHGQQVFTLDVPAGTPEGSVYVYAYISDKTTGWTGRLNDTRSADNVISVVELDPSLPILAITSPLANDNVSGEVTVNVDITNGVEVSRVELLVDNVLQSQDMTLPYSLSWDSGNLLAGEKILTARAYNLENNYNEAQVTVQVSNSLVTEDQDPFIAGDTFVFKKRNKSLLFLNPESDQLREVHIGDEFGDFSFQNDLLLTTADVGQWHHMMLFDLNSFLQVGSISKWDIPGLLTPLLTSSRKFLDVHFQDSKAYVLINSQIDDELIQGLAVYDVSDLEILEHLGTQQIVHSFGNANPHEEKGQLLKLNSGSFLVNTGIGNVPVQIVDENTGVIASLPDLNGFSDGGVLGDRVYLFDNSHPSGIELHTYDMSNSTSPVLVSSATFGGTNENIIDVAMQSRETKNFAFVLMGNYDQGELISTQLAAVNVTNPAALEIHSLVLNSGTDPFIGKHVDLVDGIAYVQNEEGTFTQRIDVNDVRNPLPTRVQVVEHESEAFVGENTPVKVSWEEVDTTKYNLAIRITDFLVGSDIPPTVSVEHFFELPSSTGEAVFDMNIVDWAGSGSAYIYVYVANKATGWEGRWEGRLAEMKTPDNVIEIVSPSFLGVGGPVQNEIVSEVSAGGQVPLTIRWQGVDTSKYNLGLKIGNDRYAEPETLIWVEDLFEFPSSGGEHVFNLNVPSDTPAGITYIYGYINNKETGWLGRADDFRANFSFVNVSNFDASKPEVTITSPISGSGLSGDVTIEASATESPQSGASIDRVEFIVRDFGSNGSVVATFVDTEAPYQAIFSNVDNFSTTYVIESRAIDVDGIVGRSEVVIFH